MFQRQEILIYFGTVCRMSNFAEWLEHWSLVVTSLTSCGQGSNPLSFLISPVLKILQVFFTWPNIFSTKKLYCFGWKISWQNCLWFKTFFYLFFFFFLAKSFLYPKILRSQKLFLVFGTENFYPILTFLWT